MRKLQQPINGAESTASGVELTLNGSKSEESPHATNVFDPHPMSKNGSGIAEEVAQLREMILAQGKQIGTLSARVKRITDREEDVRTLLADMGHQLMERSDEIQSAIYNLEMRQSSAHGGGEGDGSYREMVRRTKELVRSSLPRNATVLVASNGDPDLLNLYGRRGGHFPQTEGGKFAGAPPRTSSAAVIQLELLRAKGADYLLVPATEQGWLNELTGFKEHLETRYRVVLSEEGTCIVYGLSESANPEKVAWKDSLEEAIEAFRSGFNRIPSILDWHSGLHLSQQFPSYNIFSPSSADPSAPLPYLSKSVDLVIVPGSGAAVGEADRVAAAAVVTLDRKKPGDDGSVRFGIRWKVEGLDRTLPTASIIIPTYNGAGLMETCLASLMESLPSGFQGEIIVVDDASTDETAAVMRRWMKRDRRIKTVRNPQNSGFITSCNRGAKAATGEYLVFLNNDTVALPGWLPPLLKTFRDNADAGAVGGKLIFADGSLQEAGAIIFSDGSGANFGRGDHEIHAPLYSFLREVDYCSGALLATPRALFLEIGGFDLHYQPAYYEDTDYCFKLRERGLKVYYQPETSIIHLEGASSGPDMNTGMKRYQKINRDKFMERWKDVLRRQPSNPQRFDFATWQSLAVRTESNRGAKA